MPPSSLPTVWLNGERDENIVSPGNNTSPGKYTDKWSKKTLVSKVKMMHRKYCLGDKRECNRHRRVDLLALRSLLKSRDFTKAQKDHSRIWVLKPILFNLYFRETMI